MLIVGLPLHGEALKGETVEFLEIEETFTLDDSLTSHHARTLG